MIVYKNGGRNRICDLSYLMSGTPESYYWIGFLLADGHFKKKELVLKVCDVDYPHIAKLAKRIKAKVHRNPARGHSKAQATICAGHKEFLDKIKDKYKITQRKTYEPSDITSLSNLELKCLTLGFIDGDGCIIKNKKTGYCSLKIKCHYSWLENLRQMFPSGRSRIDSANLAFTVVGKSKILRDMKIFAKNNKIPVMRRKWDKVNLKNISTREWDYIPPERGW